MNLRTQKSESSPRVTAVELLDAIERKVAALHQRDRVLLGEQIALEQSGAPPVAAKAAPEAEQRAREILNGFASAMPPITEDNGRLHQILIERRAVAIATAALQREELRSRVVAMGLAIQDGEAEWRSITRARIDAILALRRANIAAQKFRDGLGRFTISAGYDLRCDPTGSPMFTAPSVVDEAHTFLEQCVRDGFATKKEIEIP